MTRLIQPRPMVAGRSEVFPAHPPTVRLGNGHLHVALTEKDLAAVYYDAGEDAVAEVLWQRAQRVIRAKFVCGGATRP